MHRLLPVIFLCFTLLLVLSGCNEPATGCRDINAVNYSITADEDCDEDETDECCIYPLLKLKFTHRILQTIDNRDTLVRFGLNTSYVLPAAPTDTFSFQSMSLYFSEFRLLTPEGNEVRVSDRAVADIAGDDPDSLAFINDILLFKPSATDYTVGTFNAPETYERLKFRAGLPPDLLTVDAEATEIDILQKQPDCLNYENSEVGYINQKYVFFPLPTAADSTVFSVFDVPELSLTALPFHIVSGFDATLYLTVRYDLLLADIPLSGITEEEFRARIVSNLPNAFTLDSLLQN